MRIWDADLFAQCAQFQKMKDMSDEMRHQVKELHSRWEKTLATEEAATQESIVRVKAEERLEPKYYEKDAATLRKLREDHADILELYDDGFNEEVRKRTIFFSSFFKNK